MSNQATILIVDDDITNQEALHDLLASDGYRMRFASNGIEALAQVRAEPPDLVLLDVMMPGMDGFDVCRRLRLQAETAEIPILIVTALGDRESRLKGFEAGADDFISKPFDGVELRTRVRSITRLNRYRLLQSERNKFEQVVRYAETGYLLLNKHDEIFFANPQALALLGLVGDFEDTILPTFLELVDNTYQRVPESAWKNWPGVNATEDPRYLLIPESENRSPLWLRVDVLGSYMTGVDQIFIVGMMDVTQEIALQRDIQSFHRVVEHKLRTPLIGIVSGTEILAQYVDSLSPEEVQDMTELLFQSSLRLKAAVDDVIDFATLSYEGNLNEPFDVTQLYDVVSRVCADLTLRPAQVYIDRRVTGAMPLSKTAVETIFWELIENAKKFHPKQQPNLKINVSMQGDDQLVLRFIDDGVSLSPEQLEAVWQPYYQGEKSFTGEVAGMGLGLSTVASLVWQVNGRYRIYNRSDKQGMVVELLLPLAEPQVLPGRPEPVLLT